MAIITDILVKINLKSIIDLWVNHKAVTHPFDYDTSVALHNKMKDILFINYTVTDVKIENLLIACQEVYNAVDEECERRFYRRLDLVGATVKGWDDYE